MVWGLSDEEKTQIFESMKLENFRASTRLEGLAPSEGPALALEQLKRKYTVMPTIRENLLKAIEVVQQYPEELLDLNQWRKECDCGTLYCVAGLLAIQPFFAAQGMHPYHEDGRPICGIVAISPAASWVNEMFGAGAYDRLFDQRGAGTWDPELTADVIEDDTILMESPTDKQLALRRLRKQLEQYP